MISASDYFRSLGYTLKDDNTIKENATCWACQKSAVGSPAYTCSASDDDSQPYYLHKTCSEFPMFLDFHDDHPLRLKEDIIIGEDAACCVCNTSIRGSPTYTCCSRDVVVDCENFYLHKSCAELPKHIDHHKHNTHPLSLLPLPDGWSCDICHRLVKFSYACLDCEFVVCVLCALEQRELHHEGHKEHMLLLMKKEALFECDACYERSEDSSYVCTICEFWIHKSCALSPSIIPAPTYHHHPLTLVFSIPNILRFFQRYCGICRKLVLKNYWLYYCHKCTYFVHMKCSTSTVPMVNEIEEDETDNEPDLVQFPLPSQESIFDLIVTQCGKFQVDFKGEVVNSITISTSPSDPDIIENHWSHENHPLQKLQFTISENDENDSDDYREAMICDGCIQPITVFHPSYYACIQCGFFLHSFCATKLPLELPVGSSLFHPNHSLLLGKRNRFYDFANCGVCCAATNGFYYSCQSCDIYIDIRCAFLPKRIKHKSHKHHSFVQRLSSESTCSISGFKIDSGVEYACETCNSFQIHIYCAIFPGTVEHRYDVHPITLRYPPFFYEGVFYCEICEEQVNNQDWLYHCSKSDHSFHYYCFSFHRNIKLGGTIDVTILDKPHTLTLVAKLTTRKNPTYTCSNCSGWYDSVCFLFECDGCGYLLCRKCVIDIFDE